MSILEPTSNFIRVPVFLELFDDDPFDLWILLNLGVLETTVFLAYLRLEVGFVWPWAD